MEEEHNSSQVPISQKQGEIPPILPSSSTTKSEHTVDEVIENYVGSLGFSQIIQVFLVSFAWVFDAQSTLLTIFSDAEPEWRCMSSFGMCNGMKGGKGSSVCGLKPGTWEWVGGHKSTTVAEWGLVCDHKFLAAIPASAFFIGSLIGSGIYGRLADTILGRKKTLILSCLLTSITGVVTSLSPNIWVYAFMRFSNGLTRSGIGICCIVLATEVIGRKWRGQVGQYGFFFFTLGFASVPLIAYYNKTSWRSLHSITSVFPFVYSLILIPLVKESPRWLLIRGDKTQALKVLTSFARRNGKTIPSGLQLSDPNFSNNTNDQNAPRMGLWGCKWSRVRMLTAMVAGFGVGFVYYGIQLNVENLNFSKYLTVLINAAMEIPAVFLGSLLIGVMKRRMLFSLSCYTAGVSCILCMVFNKSRFGNWGSWVQLGVDAIGFLTASMAFDVLYIYCVELFATNVRNFAVSMLRQSLMLGASMAPVFVAVGRLSPSVSFLVFGGFAIVSGVVSFWLPETKDCPLYETLEQQEKEEKLWRENCALGGGRGEQRINGDGVCNC